jgi:hypothetical protein
MQYFIKIKKEITLISSSLHFRSWGKILQAEKMNRDFNNTIKSFCGKWQACSISKKNLDMI